jgi:CheY-like chemotaxis protein
MEMTKGRILVVEDDNDLREAICLFLELNGFTFIAVSDGKEAIDKLKKFRSFDLILCDINLPHVLGYEVLRYVRQDPVIQNTPFLFLTAYADKRDMKLGMDLGADDYITKPFSNKDLISKIFSLVKMQDHVDPAEK